MSIYLSRIMSSFCLFVLLAEANIWTDPLNNTVLVFGYRFFIVITPVLFAFRKHATTQLAFVISLFGLGCWLFEQDLVGTVAIGTGLAVSGYMLKYYASHSASGAAMNKIAINVGSVLSGLVVAISQDKTVLLFGCALLMIISLLSFNSYFKNQEAGLSEGKGSSKANFSLDRALTKQGMAWMLIGFVIGVKLISIVSILPQFIIKENEGGLPSWFGGMMVANSLIVIMFQLPIIRRISTWSRVGAVLPLSFGMVIILLSQPMRIETLVGALTWTFLLSLVECTISYLDKLSRDDGCLLIKEAAVGLGSAATVFLVREFEPSTGAVIVATFSIALTVISILLLNAKVRSSSASCREAEGMQARIVS